MAAWIDALACQALRGNEVAWKKLSPDWSGNDERLPHPRASPCFGVRVTIDPGEAVVLVRFDPSDGALLAEFRNYYSIDDSVQMIGPYTDSLDNAGDTVRLLRPDYPPAWEPHHWPHVVEDEMLYDDVDPWPAAADGQGASLHRRRADGWGHDPASWTAAPPTPGSVNLPLRNLAITELNYNPYDPTNEDLAVDPSFENDHFEFVELLNFGEEAIDLTGVQCGDGIVIEFPEMAIAPDERIVIVRNLATFQARYGTEINVAAQYTGGLRNSGERLVLDEHRLRADSRLRVFGQCSVANPGRRRWQFAQACRCLRQLR